MKLFIKRLFLPLFALLLAFVLSQVYLFRLDLTSDKRHSLSKQSLRLIKQLDEPLYVDFYLSGGLNAGFTQLKSAALDLLEELNAKAGKQIYLQVIDPNDPDNEGVALYLEQEEMPGIAVFEKDKAGKAVRKTVYPWMEIRYKDKKTAVNVLKNLPGLSGEENLNISIESLEFEVTEAIFRLTNQKLEKIAFLEGQGELDELECYEISKSLSRYFQIDRGKIEQDARILNEYEVLIVVRPLEAFSEAVKFAIDQYIMQGGAVLWLIDAVQLSEERLASLGETPVIARDVNLDDLFFRYGVRFRPALVLDANCIQLPMRVADAANDVFLPFPFVYSPLLLTSQNHAITKNLVPVLSHFPTAIELTGNTEQLSHEVLLASSSRSFLEQTPSEISLNHLPEPTQDERLNLAHIPVAVLLEGEFRSAFQNRMVPSEIQFSNERRNQSSFTRQLFVADGRMLRNELVEQGDSVETLPVGLDRYSGTVYGNSEFIVNSVLYLSGKSERIELRSRTLPLRLLQKGIGKNERLRLQLVNIALPLVVLLVFGLSYHFYRKRKFGRKQHVIKSKSKH